MKRNPTSPGALPRYFFAAVLLASFPAVAQTISNPSFEDTANFTASPGYISSGTPQNGPINGWTANTANRTGINPSTTSPFADNGIIPNGSKVAFLQAVSGTVPTLETTITGLTPGTKYHVAFRTNARSSATTNGNLPFLNVGTPGAGATVGAEIQRVQSSGATVAYRHIGYDFTAVGTEQVLRLSNVPKGSDNTVLFDDFSIAPSTNSWSTLAWEGDAPEIFDASHSYTHAYNFNGGFVRVNNVAFLPTASQAGYYSVAGLASVHGGMGVTDNLITGASETLSMAFQYGGDPAITIQNLKPNTEYVASIYGVGWDAQTPNPYYRSATFSSSLGGERYTVNLNQFGKGKGLIVQYRYTTDASGTPVTISYPPLSPAAGTFHTSAFSNREVTPSAPQWTASPWTGDGDSGVSSTEPYTHAFKFGATGTFNINGVNFTGVAGANPTGPGFTTAGLPSVFNNDINEVTGGGAPLAKDFLYGGFPSTINLTGLTPGKQYVFSLYSVGWNDGLREASLIGPGSPRNVLDQSSLGDNKGIRFDYTYTAPANGIANFVYYGRDGVKSIHTYGFTNRETEPFVDKEPEITAQPVGATIGVGATHVLRVGVLGSPTLSYQWKKGLDDVPGATGPELVLDDVLPADAGDYSVVITNDDGTATSDVVSVVVRENAPGNFNTGIGPDGVARAAGQIDPNFRIIVNPDNPESEAAYVQSGLPGPWIANSATSVWIGPRQDTQFAAGAPVTDPGSAEPAGTYVYRMTVDLTNFNLDTVSLNGRWSSDNGGTEIRVNGTPVGFANTVGNTFAVYVPFDINNTAFPGLLVNGPNTVDFVVNNLTEGYTGLRLDQLQITGELPPNTAPHIGIQPQSMAGPHNGTVLLGVGASGTSPLSYQWYEGTTLLDGETGPSLSIPIIDLDSGGNFKVVVTNPVSSVESNVAVVSVPNALPVAVADLLETDKDVPLIITPIFDMLPNDTDADGDAIELQGFSATTSAGGTVVQDADTLVYTPPAGFEGLDTFTYTVNDGLWGGVSTNGTVTVTVGNPGVAEPQGLAVVLTGGDIVATFTGSPGGSYTLQRSTDLDEWLDVDTDTASAEGAVQLTDPDPVLPRAFYRISYLPAQ